MSLKSMRCIHVVPAISEEAMGPSYSVVRLCEALIGHGQVVTLAALDWVPMKSSLPFLKTFPLGAGPRRLGRSPRMMRWLADTTRHSHSVILHSHSLWMMPNVYPGWVARKNKIPLVVSPRGTLSEWAMNNGSAMKRIFWPLVQRPALVHTACFHATAESEYLDIRRAGFLQPVAVVPNGIDIPSLHSNNSKGPRTLLFLGRIHPKKGLDLLLHAWHAVEGQFPEWRLRIVGPDNRGYLEEMRCLAADLKLERAEFIGALYGEQKQLAYGDADLFVLPTRSENFGMAVAESLAAGTPAIVSKGAPWEGLEKHKAGWWVDIGVDPLEACLENALSCSSEDLYAMGMRGREWMKAEFSWTKVGGKMTEMYQWILNGGPPPESVRVN